MSEPSKLESAHGYFARSANEPNGLLFIIQPDKSTGPKFSRYHAGVDLTSVGNVNYVIPALDLDRLDYLDGIKALSDITCGFSESYINSAYLQTDWIKKIIGEFRDFVAEGKAPALDKERMAHQSILARNTPAAPANHR